MKELIANIVLSYYSRYPERMREDTLHTHEVVIYTYLIATGEKIPEMEIDLLVAAAWLHDIGCPRSTEIYGNSLPENQQSIGRQIASDLLAPLDCLSPLEKQWLVDVVGTHHQFSKAKELGSMPLFEADLIVNVLSGYHAKEKAQLLYDTMMVSQTGRKLFKTLIG
ncbi:MAG: HD domain-containing protein [Rikenellaceae bacterium]